VARLALLGCLVLGLAGATLTRVGATGYDLVGVFPDAANLVRGSRVRLDGLDVGAVRSISTRDGMALVRFSVDDDHAPLRDGTQLRIDYQALLGERVITVLPGPADNPRLQSGAMIQGGAPRVDLDMVLRALDPDVRDALQSDIDGLRGVLEPRADQAQATIVSSGPAVAALGEVLAAVGNDGPALRDLVLRAREMVSILLERRDEVSGTIDGLTGSLEQMAAERAALGESISQLPETLTWAESTLDRVPGTVEETRPLLDALAPATEQLPGIAADLRPLLGDLRPLVADLRPAAASLATVLTDAPPLLGDLRALLPEADAATAASLAALDFLRPYTPELAGWLSNWGSVGASYDANGHYARIHVSAGPENVNRLPFQLPTNKTNVQRAPGELEGQPWTDAAGSEMH
jgi:phospholipid/cholesterol/gamma-HCH transport system substrate-binding protein